jgi:hypothetical protein
MAHKEREEKGDKECSRHDNRHLVFEIFKCLERVTKVKSADPEARLDYYRSSRSDRQVSIPVLKYPVRTKSLHCKQRRG